VVKNGACLNYSRVYWGPKELIQLKYLNILDWEVAKPYERRGGCIKWYQSLILFLGSREETKKIV